MMNANLNQLHDTDFNLWIEQIKLKIQNRDFDDMDWNNLIDEIDDMGASQKRALDSYTKRLVEHILKLNFWRATPRRRKAQGNARENSEVERCRRGWMKEVANFRKSIKRILKKNPSLKNYLAEEYKDIYQDAVDIMRFDFDIPDDNFIALEQIMNEDYFGN